MVDSHTTRAICDLVPSGFLSLSKSHHDDLAAECMISIGLIAAIFEADNSDKALSARQDHRDLDKELHLHNKFDPNESIDTFQHRWQRRLTSMTLYSSVPKFSFDHVGDCECIEHLIHLLGSERCVGFEKKKLKYKTKRLDPPGLTVFWEVLRSEHVLLDLQEARKISVGNRAVPKERQTRSLLTPSTSKRVMTLSRRSVSLCLCWVAAARVTNKYNWSCWG